MFQKLIIVQDREKKPRIHFFFSFPTRKLTINGVHKGGQKLSYCADVKMFLQTELLCIVLRRG